MKKIMETDDITNLKMEYIKYMTLKMAWAPKPMTAFIVEYEQGMMLGNDEIKKCIIRAEKEKGERFQAALDNHEGIDVTLKYIGIEPILKLHAFDLIEIKN